MNDAQKCFSFPIPVVLPGHGRQNRMMGGLVAQSYRGPHGRNERLRRVGLLHDGAESGEIFRETRRNHRNAGGSVFIKLHRIDPRG